MCCSPSGLAVFTSSLFGCRKFFLLFIWVIVFSLVLCSSSMVSVLIRRIYVLMYVCMYVTCKRYKWLTLLHSCINTWNYVIWIKMNFAELQSSYGFGAGEPTLFSMYRYTVVILLIWSICQINTSTWVSHYSFECPYYVVFVKICCSLLTNNLCFPLCMDLMQA